jgi:hypothetical protein
VRRASCGATCVAMSHTDRVNSHLWHRDQTASSARAASARSVSDTRRSARRRAEPTDRGMFQGCLVDASSRIFNFFSTVNWRFLRGIDSSLHQASRRSAVEGKV